MALPMVLAPFRVAVMMETSGMNRPSQKTQTSRLYAREPAPRQENGGALKECFLTETLFSSLKVERLHGMHFATRRQAKDEVIDWLQFNNHPRLHSTLGYLSRWPSRKNGLPINQRLPHNRSANGDAKREQVHCLQKLKRRLFLLHITERELFPQCSMHCADRQRRRANGKLSLST
jgi:Integrase core domain